MNDAEIQIGGAYSVGRIWLQWGRVMNDAEIGYVTDSGRTLCPLQWGRVMNDAEIGVCFRLSNLHCLGFNGAAS